PPAWPEPDAERTETISAVSDAPGPSERTRTADRFDTPSGPFDAVKDALRNRRGLVRGGIVAAAILGVLTVLYVGDLATSAGKVPRGTVVAGVPIGGMSKDRAEDRLRDELGPGLHEPIEVRAGDSTATIN